MDKLGFNICVGLHNCSMITEAKKLINNFIEGEGFVYAVNPDGSYLPLQAGVDLVAVTGLGVTVDE